MKNAIVLVIDRLNAGFLGPYGNTWVETPCFNQLAAESALFEFALSDSPDLPTGYRSFWSGLHAMSGHRDVPGLASTASAAGIHTVLITDDEQVAAHPWADGFREKIAVPVSPLVQAAAEIGQTQLAQLLATAIEWLQAASASSTMADRPFLLWIHSRGMQGPWDAPFEFREQFADEDDPVPPKFVAPPVRWVAEDEDPDQLLGVQHAYAGQISLLDSCLEVFLEACWAGPEANQPLFLLTSPRGYPLGEHRRLGPVDQTIYGEHLHVPCLIRYPDGAHALVRCHELVQPSDVFATLLDWFALPRVAAARWGQSLTNLLDGQAHSDRVAAVSGSCRALRTAAWFLHCDGDSNCSLFAKPDDRWEANEVSDRCRELLPGLIALLDEFQRAASCVEPVQLSEIPPAIANSQR
ncbi:MAG: sulfatase-like hydrolase/transferase [Pirellulaceae bacterium]|nr:sulfatase-like hydrolase/transferase [Pirellulaceae bacterium]